MRAWHVLVGTLCIVVAVGAARTQESDSLPEQAPVELTIEVLASSLEIRGIVSSVAHQAILNQTVLTLFPGKKASYALEIRPALPPGWALITDLSLRALAGTRSATASVTPTTLVIRGITSSGEQWLHAAARIERNLLPGMRFTHRVEEIRSQGSLNRQCIELFRTAQRGRRIEFARDEAALGTAALPLLDELVQIASDCPASSIRISGHTDSTGDETANRQLSQQRADAVAAYMIERGIPAQRIIASGVGSSQPLADEGSARARQLNRRIEIDIDFP